jgi:RNA polymerase sigma-70 factor (ECF subfamily)
MDILQHKTFIHNTCKTLAPNVYNDIEQDVIIKLSDKNPPPININGYIYRTCKNTITDHHRKNQSQRKLTSHRTNTDIQPFIECELRNKVRQLPRELRRLIWLLSMDYKYEEIARIVRKPIGTIKSEIHKARKLIKVSL